MKIHSKVKSQKTADVPIGELSSELRRLGSFWNWKVNPNDPSVIGFHSLANSELFAKTGGIQQVLLGLAYFRTGYDTNQALQLKLCVKYSWQDVLDKLRSIDRIDLEED